MENGVEHADGAVVMQTIKMIKHMRPVMFILKNVMVGSGKAHARATDSVDDLNQIEKFVEDQVGDFYHSMTICNISPIQAGYPTKERRFFVIGGRKDMVHGGKLSNIFTKMIANPVPLTHNYWNFLGLERISDESMR